MDSESTASRPRRRGRTAIVLSWRNCIGSGPDGVPSVQFADQDHSPQPVLSSCAISESKSGEVDVADYLCPNPAIIRGRPRRVLHNDKPDLSTKARNMFGQFMRVPKPAFCDVC